MPSYMFAFELLPNIWIGLTPAVTDATFRKKYHIIRDIMIHSKFSTPPQPYAVSKTAESHDVIMDGTENELQLKSILTQLFPIITDCYQKDRGLLLSGESWNSPHIKVIILWCAKYGSLSQTHVLEKVKKWLPTS